MIKHRIIPIVLLAIVVTACEHKIAHIDKVLIVDKSMSQEEPNDKRSDFIEYLINTKRLIESGDEMNLHFIECGSAPIPSSLSVHLQSANMLITPGYEREEEVLKFRSAAQANFDSLLFSPYQDKLSQTYRSFIYALSLINSGADVRHIYFRSDFLECSPLVDFEKLKSFDYETVKTIFISDQPLPKITEGLSVTLINTSQSEKSLQAVRIWSRLLQEAGATVYLQANLSSL